MQFFSEGRNFLLKCCTVLKSGQHRDYDCEVSLSGPEIMLQAICVGYVITIDSFRFGSHM